MRVSRAELLGGFYGVSRIERLTVRQMIASRAVVASAAAPGVADSAEGPFPGANGPGGGPLASLAADDPAAEP
jgi:hypothetical protein